MTSTSELQNWETGCIIRQDYNISHVGNIPRERFGLYSSSLVFHGKEEEEKEAAEQELYELRVCEYGELGGQTGYQCDTKTYEP